MFGGGGNRLDIGAGAFRRLCDVARLGRAVGGQPGHAGGILLQPLGGAGDCFDNPLDPGLETIGQGLHFGPAGRGLAPLHLGGLIPAGSLVALAVVGLAAFFGEPRLALRLALPAGGLGLGGQTPVFEGRLLEDVNRLGHGADLVAPPARGDLGVKVAPGQPPHGADHGTDRRRQAAADQIAGPGGDHPGQHQRKDHEERQPVEPGKDLAGVDLDHGHPAKPGETSGAFRMGEGKDFGIAFGIVDHAAAAVFGHGGTDGIARSPRDRIAGLADRAPGIHPGDFPPGGIQHGQIGGTEPIQGQMLVIFAEGGGDEGDIGETDPIGDDPAPRRLHPGREGQAIAVAPGNPGQQRNGGGTFDISAGEAVRPLQELSRADCLEPGFLRQAGAEQGGGRHRLAGGVAGIDRDHHPFGIDQQHQPIDREGRHIAVDRLDQRIAEIGHAPIIRVIGGGIQGKGLHIAIAVGQSAVDRIDHFIGQIVEPAVQRLAGLALADGIDEVERQRRQQSESDQQQDNAVMNGHGGAPDFIFRLASAKRFNKTCRAAPLARSWRDR